jgi:predicted PurR-regulated permease PerM
MLDRTEGDVANTLRWIAGIALGILILALTAQVLLLAFAGVLLAILLRCAALVIAARTRFGPGWALAGVLITTALSMGCAAWLLAPEVISQGRQLTDQIPRSWQSLQDRLEGMVGGRVLDQVSDQVSSPNGSAIQDLIAQALSLLSTTLGAIGSAIVIFFIGLYLAIDPATYRDGLVRLIAPHRRDRARDVLFKVGDTLLWWLIGKLASMTVVGALTFVGLWFLEIPLALTLALIACALTFIPNFGPILSAAPAVLLALGESASQASWVVGLYLAVQTVESYLITPLIQQRTVSLPPALTLTAQILAGVLAGVAGLALATPLTAAAVVLVRELYVEDVLEERRPSPL